MRISLILVLSLLFLLACEKNSDPITSKAFGKIPDYNWVFPEAEMRSIVIQLGQANWEKIQKAVYETSGKIITYNNKPINAFFHSNSGGTTELPVNVWGGGTDLPYLHVVETSGEDGAGGAESE